MSTFVAHHIEPLHQAISPKRTAVGSQDGGPSPRKQKLHSLLVSLKEPQSVNLSVTQDTIVALDDGQNFFLSSQETDDEEIALNQAVLQKLTVTFYAQVLDTWLAEATETEAEAEWWGDVERSRENLIWYLIATSPERLKRLMQTMLQTLRSRNLPIRPSSFTPSSIRRLFPQTLHPSLLTTSLFPHLSQRSHFIFTSPLELTRQECRLRRKALEDIRDERAADLGTLTGLRNELLAELQAPSVVDVQGAANLAYFFSVFYGIVTPGGSRVLPEDVRNRGVSPIMRDLALVGFPGHRAAHLSSLESLRRPSRLTLLWPRLAIIPPVSWIVFRYLYSSRASIAETAANAWETVTGFWNGYLLEPIKGILNTVRRGGDDSMRIVSAEGVKADIESLERMALALSRDKLGYSSSQLQELSEQIRKGDLSPILRVYEEDIKSPIISAIGGSLVRALLIQIQKTKVDVDQAMMGIDKLLKSQELTFAFVGVAPALAVVYVVGGYFRSLWLGTVGHGRHGGSRRKTSVWLAMRRIERLLITQPPISINTKSGDDRLTLTPLTSGLLLLSVAHLRTYAEKHLPVRSRLREGFLEDVADLEDPALGRQEKQRVVDRMWKSWGSVLGWNTIAGDRERRL